MPAGNEQFLGRGEGVGQAGTGSRAGGIRCHALPSHRQVLPGAGQGNLGASEGGQGRDSNTAGA